jgi:hypothetical protein
LKRGYDIHFKHFYPEVTDLSMAKSGEKGGARHEKSYRGFEKRHGQNGRI